MEEKLEIKKENGKEEEMTIQEEMLNYRAKENISQTELAKRCGVSVQTINSIENGLQDPSKLTRAKIYLIIKTESEKED